MANNKTNYRAMPVGTVVNGGTVGICPVCGEPGLITKREPKDGVVVIDICHAITPTLQKDGTLLIHEDEHFSLEPEHVSDVPPT